MRRFARQAVAVGLFALGVFWFAERSLMLG